MQKQTQQTQQTQTEMALLVLDDMLSARGQQGTREEGMRALRAYFPNLNNAQHAHILRVWEQEMLKAGADMSGF